MYKAVCKEVIRGDCYILACRFLKLLLTCSHHCFVSSSSLMVVARSPVVSEISVGDLIVFTFLRLISPRTGRHGDSINRLIPNLFICEKS